MKNLILFRGIPGSGKSTFASAFVAAGYTDGYIETDDYFYDQWGKYVFDAGLLDAAHLDCYNRAEKYMKRGENFAVANCFVLEKHIQPYKDLAKRYGYNVQEVWIMPSKFESEHAVPDEIIQRMKTRFFNTMREVATSQLKEMQNGNQETVKS